MPTATRTTLRASVTALLREHATTLPETEKRSDLEKAITVYATRTGIEKQARRIFAEMLTNDAVPILRERSQDPDLEVETRAALNMAAGYLAHLGCESSQEAWGYPIDQMRYVYCAEEAGHDGKHIGWCDDAKQEWEDWQTSYIRGL